MTDIDRRALIGAAGAGLALAACSENPNSAAKSADGKRGTDDVKPAMAPGPHHGLDPHQPHQNGGPFKPDFICAIYIRFDDAKKTIVRHGYLDTKALPAGKSEEEAAWMLMEAARKAKDADEWTKAPLGHPRKEFNFNGLTFGHTARLYVMVDNENVKFDDRKTKIGGTEYFANLVRFTPYRVDTTKTDFTLTGATENYSFFNAKIIEMGGTRILQIENWFKKKDGSAPSAADPDIFSLNINLFWESADKTGVLMRIPIVIDPDTGNGGSYP